MLACASKRSIAGRSSTVLVARYRPPKVLKNGLEAQDASNPLQQRDVDKNSLSAFDRTSAKGRQSVMSLTPREAMINALERRAPVGRVPHFELQFFLTMEALGRVHPRCRNFRQWTQMSTHERSLHRRDVADLHVAIYRKFGLSGTIYFTPAAFDEEDRRTSLEHFREMSGQEFFVSMHGDATYSVPGGKRMMEFVGRIADDPDGVKSQAQKMVDEALVAAARIKEWGTVDGFCLCSDYCYNDNPFLSPAMFDDYITPYLVQLVAGYREMGFYTIKHTDGNIMPILDSLMAAKPHALHSLDPQGGIDLAELKQRIGDQVCLVGNVNCGLLQTGTDEEICEDVRRALRDGMPGGGYVFGTSNCIYTGVSLERYEMMLEIWRQEGNYGQ
jgi:uroporphyrinogen decarboxylase